MTVTHGWSSGSGSSLDLPESYESILLKLRGGFTIREYERFLEITGLDDATVSKALAIPKRTFVRRRSEGRLKPDESERLWRLGRVFDRAADLFDGEPDAARRWLRAPAKALGGQTPLEAAETEVGAREVEMLIGRIEHGVVT